MDIKERINALVFLSIALNNSIQHGKVPIAETEIISFMLKNEVDEAKHESAN